MARGDSVGGDTRRDGSQHDGSTRREGGSQDALTRRNDAYGGETRRLGGQDDAATRRTNANADTRRYQAGGGGGGVYDQHAGFTKRIGAGGNDRNQNGGYTKRFGKKDLKNAEEGGGPSKKDRLKSLAANGLLGAEKQGGGAAESLYKGDGGGGGLMGKLQNSGWLKKNKKKVIAGSAVGAGILPLLALLVFMLGALKIPHFVENMATWRFVKVTNQYRRSMTNVMGAKAALDSLDDAARAQAVQRYGKYKVFDGINRLRPNRVLASLQTADRLQYNYKTTLTGKQKLVSITIAEGQDFRNRTTYKVPSGRFDRLIHPLRSLDQYRSVSNALNSAMKAHDPKIPNVVRSAATKNVIKKAGGSLKGLVAAKYLGKDNSPELTEKTKQVSDIDKQMDALEKRQTQLDEAAIRAFANSADILRQLNDLHTQWMSVSAKLDAINISDPDWVAKRQPLYAQWDAIRAKQQPLLTGNLALSEEGVRITNERITIYNRLTTLQLERDKLQAEAKNKGGVISDREGKIAIQQETYERVNDKGGIAGISSDEGKKLAQEVADETDKVVQDTEKMGASVDKGNGIPDEVLNVVEKGTDPGRLSEAFKKVVGFANPVYDIAMPVCMMYDGSKITSEQLDAQQNASMREALMVLSAGDQQKGGTDWTTPMANAINWKAGDIQDSMAMRRVSGKPADTTQGIGGQRTALGTYGQYTIFDALMGGNAGGLNDFADDVCPVVTNIWFGIGLGVVNIAIVVFSGGTAGGAEAAATAGAKTVIEKSIMKVVRDKIASFTLKKGIKAFAKSGRFAKQFGKDVVKWGAITAGAVFMARAIVMNSAGTMTSGLETKAAFLDNADLGANHVANEAMRANYMARPINNVEIAQNFKTETNERTFQNQQKSTFDRYLALENPDSLLTRTAVTTSSLVNRGIFSSILNSLATLFNPTALTSRLFAGANAQGVFAAGNTNTRDYGNVQWDYSAEERRLMTEVDSYASPPENERILDLSGKESEISDTYTKCWEKTPGKLLQDGDITRNEEGDVLPEGDCSPLQLGVHNPEYGDLVFRWRLKHNYDNTTGLLNGIADPQPNGALPSGTGTAVIPSGTAQQLATQILNNPNITFQVEPQQRQYMDRIAKTGHGRDCGGPAADPKMLGVILALAQKYKIVIGVVIDDHDCNGGFHPKGKAFDMNGITKLDGSATTGNKIEMDPRNEKYTTSEQPLLKEFYDFAGGVLVQAGGGGMGQIQCFTGSTPKLHTPQVNYFNDTCHHLHIDVGKR